jgi:RNA polymerase sigma-70 factor (ECF subfamily)
MASSKTDLALDLPLRATHAVPSHIASAHAETLRLFDECGPGLRRYLRSCGLPADAADDIVQETFICLFRHLCLDRPSDNLKGWLFRVGHRLASKHRQREIRRSSRERSFDPSIVDLVSDGARSAEDTLCEEERRLRLQAVVHALPERARQCLFLRAEGLRYREIAKVLQVSLGGVAKSLALAMTRLSNAARE